MAFVTWLQDGALPGSDGNENVSEALRRFPASMTIASDASTAVRLIRLTRTAKNGALHTSTAVNTPPAITNEVRLCQFSVEQENYCAYLCGLDKSMSQKESTVMDSG